MLKNELIVVHGGDIASMTREALAAARIEALIPPAARIALKPNLVVAKPASSGATTHPEIVRAVIEYLRERGFNRISIMEGSWVGDSTSRAFIAAGYQTLSTDLSVPLIDLQRDSWKRYDAGGGLKIAVCDQAMAADFIINLPVVKGHCQTTVTCALKNLKGCMPDDEKSRFHELGLHEPIARLNRVLKSGFILADGICGDLDFEEGGNPVPMHRLVAGIDPVLLDAYACRLMGHDPEEVAYIGLAEEYGVGSANLEAARIIELGDKEAAPNLPARSGRVRALAARIEERSACSACYAALVHGLARMEERGLLKKLDAARADAAPKTFVLLALEAPADRHARGVGVCARGARDWVRGCPPDGAAVTAFLEKIARGM